MLEAFRIAAWHPKTRVTSPVISKFKDILAWLERALASHSSSQSQSCREGFGLALAQALACLVTFVSARLARISTNNLSHVIPVIIGMEMRNLEVIFEVRDPRIRYRYQTDAMMAIQIPDLSLLQVH
jgi:hypothetical protein